MHVRYAGWIETIAESHFDDNRSAENKEVFPAKYSLIKHDRRTKKHRQTKKCCPILVVMRALIVKNNNTHRDMLVRALAEQGFDTDMGDSIESARSYVDSEDYDIICVNQELKDGPGEEFVAYCNAHEQQKDTPILFLTENVGLVADELSVRVDGVIHELNEQQTEDQIIHFIDHHLDPVFFEGRILLVEDDDEIAADILNQLKQTGYQVSYFKSADEANAEFDAVTVYGSHADAYEQGCKAMIWSLAYVPTRMAADLSQFLRYPTKTTTKGASRFIGLASMIFCQNQFCLKNCWSG
jgi:CheY-like chemotaxis protein